ncbi:MAG TPA: beta-ketoacyl synthase, partial [Ferruginibacter sp.]|nr:beta-ketoacyl synthase [Ferruginibacter sp.]
NQHVSINDIDFIITGNNGDATGDEIYEALSKTVFANKKIISYKHLCGEYPTAAAFALWLAANTVKFGKPPAMIENNYSSEKKIQKVLIYNHYLGIHHSLYLLSAC